MAITKEELKVGESYIDDSERYGATVKYIGECNVISDRSDGVETVRTLNYFLSNYSIVKKPKIKKRYLTLRHDLPAYDHFGKKLADCWDIKYEVISDEEVETDE